LLLRQRRRHEFELDRVAHDLIETEDAVRLQRRLWQEFVADPDRKLLGDLAVAGVNLDALRIVVEPVVGLAIGSRKSLKHVTARREGAGVDDMHPYRLVVRRWRVAAARDQPDFSFVERIESEGR